jgi:hypothetical protein
MKPPSADRERTIETILGAELAVSRRALLKSVAAFTAVIATRPWRFAATPAFAQIVPDDPLVTVPTLEAFADTLIPGEKRFPTDRAIAGVVSGPGAVQAGALALMNHPPVGIEPTLPAYAATINARAVAYAGTHLIVLDPTVPPMVSLDFSGRTAVVVEILDATTPDQLAFYALAAIPFLAYHTAGHLPTADAIRDGHPGLAAIGFPPPDPDGLWRFPEFSYRRALAPRHPRAKRGNPA